MKLSITVACMLLYSQIVSGQQFPGCENFKIEHIALTDSGYVAVEMSNNCVDCQSGITGCVYAEMKIINKYDATDTLAASDCFCLMAPPNEGSSLYLLPTSITTLPPIDSVRFYFFCEHPACEEVSISENALAASAINVRSQFKIYPNPASGPVYLDYANDISVQSIQLTDVLGRTIKVYKKNEKVLDVSGLKSGVYFLNIQTKEGPVAGRIIIN